MDINLVSLLKDSLRLANCHEDIIADFDDNSTIALEFTSNSEMYLFLDKEKNRVMVWSPVCDTNDYLLSRHAFPLLKKVLEPIAYSDIGHPYLQQNENKLYLHCIFHDDYVGAPEKFLEALSHFFELVQECVEIAR